MEVCHQRFNERSYNKDQITCPFFLGKVYCLQRRIDQYADYIVVISYRGASCKIAGADKGLELVEPFFSWQENFLRHIDNNEVDVKVISIENNLILYAQRLKFFGTTLWRFMDA